MRHKKRGLAYPLLLSVLCHTPFALRIRPTLPPWCDIRGHSLWLHRFFLTTRLSHPRRG